MVSSKKQVKNEYKEQIENELKEAKNYVILQESYLNKYNLPKHERNFLNNTISFWNNEIKKLENILVLLNK